MTLRSSVPILIYAACCVIALLLPWWAALLVLILPLLVYPYYGAALVFGLILDLVYGYQKAGFPYHTFRYAVVVFGAVIFIFLLKKVLRL